jgi:uncharacterized membrane protein YjdF
MQVIWLAAHLTGVHPHGYFIWILEAAPPLIAAAIWAVAHERFRLTPLESMQSCKHSCPD